MDAVLESELHAVAAVPAGAWGVGVSGGADSVALLRALACRSDMKLTVLHFDHQLRGAESDGDAEFVVELAQRLGLPLRLGRSEDDLVRTPPNPQARYRAVRLRFFARAVNADQLQGVLLAHHAGDQAETVLLRLLRHAGPLGLGGMAADTVVSGLRIVRPLLETSAEATRDACRALGQPWRDDSSNAATKYRRNAVRQWLADKPDVAAALLRLGRASAAARSWADSTASRLGESFAARELAGLPEVLARVSAARWLVERGASHIDITDAHADQLVSLARRVENGERRRCDFPGSVHVLGTRGMVSTEW